MGQSLARGFCRLWSSFRLWQAVNVGRLSTDRFMRGNVGFAGGCRRLNGAASAGQHFNILIRKEPFRSRRHFCRYRCRIGLVIERFAVGWRMRNDWIGP